MPLHALHNHNHKAEEVLFADGKNLEEKWAIGGGGGITPPVEPPKTTNFDKIDIDYSNSIVTNGGTYKSSNRKDAGFVTGGGVIFTQEIANDQSFEFKLLESQDTLKSDLYLFVATTNDNTGGVAFWSGGQQTNGWTFSPNGVFTHDVLNGSAYQRPNISNINPEDNCKLVQGKTYRIEFDEIKITVYNVTDKRTMYTCPKVNMKFSENNLVNRVGFWAGKPAQPLLLLDEDAGALPETPAFGAFTARFNTAEGYTLQAIGDSLTFASENVNYNGGHNFLSKLKAWLQLETVLNKGIGGSCLANNGASSFVQRLINNEFLKTSEINTIWYGHNDQANNIAIGDYNSDDATTFNGALNFVMPKILKEWSGRTIFVTPSAAEEGSYTGNNSATIRDFRDALIEKCIQYGFQYLDVYGASQINKHNYNLYCYDGIHYNQKGYDIISTMFANEIDYYSFRK